MSIFNRKEKTLPVPEECKDFSIEVDKSICTGEMTVGFRDPTSGRLKYAELAKSGKDIENYKKKYGRL